MTAPRRRRVLAALAVAPVLGLAGCSDEENAGLVAVNAQVVYGEGYPDLEYPSDVGVRVTVENEAQRRLEGTVVAELELLDEDSDRDPQESWSAERTVSLSSFTTQTYMFVFEDANADGVDASRFSADTYVSESGAADDPDSS